MILNQRNKVASPLTDLCQKCRNQVPINDQINKDKGLKGLPAMAKGFKESLQVIDNDRKVASLTINTYRNI